MNLSNKTPLSLLVAILSIFIIPAAWDAVALLKGKIAGSLFRYQNRRKWVTFALAKSKGGDAMLAKIGVLLAMLLGAFGIGGDDPRGRDE